RKSPAFRTCRRCAPWKKVGFRIVREGKHIVMSDGRRILTVPRHNAVNAYTMDGVVSPDRRHQSTVQHLALDLGDAEARQRQPQRAGQLTSEGLYLDDGVGGK